MLRLNRTARFYPARLYCLGNGAFESLSGSLLARILINDGVKYYPLPTAVLVKCVSPVSTQVITRFLLSRTPCIVYIFFFKFGLYASCRANPSPLRFNILLQPCLRVRDRFRWRFIGFGCEPCRQRNTLSRIVFLFSIYMSVIRMQCYASVRKAFIIHLSFIQSNM